jgi:hypothetical protein
MDVISGKYAEISEGTRSPCVNTGSNQDWMTNAVDLEGNARILNNIVDMGAYETLLWQGTIYRIP